MKRWLLGFVLLLLVVLLGMALVPQAPITADVELTRLLWPERDRDPSLEQPSVAFSATPGAGRLTATRHCDGAWPQVRLNGLDLRLSDAVLPVTLSANNELHVLTASACANLRITQTQSVSMHVRSRVHFNTNVSNFERAREFYGSLGFDTLSGFPDTNTQAMARAIGIETPTSYDGSQGDFAGGYLLHGELVGPGGFAGGVIDLIEFSVPRNEAPPYAQLNHLGMARAVMHTTDVDADASYLLAKQVSFLSPPVTRADGSRFAIFHDLDGTSYELRQPAGIVPDRSSADSGTHIYSLGAVSINVSDFRRSQAWYQMLGFELSETLPETETPEVAKALGFDRPWTIEGAVVQHKSDGSTLELVQWHSPFDPEPPYPLPVNHLGLHRMAFSTSDIESDVAVLKAQGVEFVSPITPCCSGDDSWGAIVAFLDPDGTVLELVEQPVMTPLLNLSMRIGALLGTP